MSTNYKNSRDVPLSSIILRLEELSAAITGGRESRDREFTMRIPAECDRDADLVISESATRIVSLRSELTAARGEVERLRGRVVELTEMFAQGFDADGDPDEWRERAMKSVAGGLNSANAFIKRKQAEAIQDWLHGEGEMDLSDCVERLYREAEAAEKGGDDEPA